MVTDVTVGLHSTSASAQELTGSYFITTSRDMTARLYTVDPLDGFMPKSFGGHRDIVLRAFFSEDEKTVRLSHWRLSWC